MGKVIKVEPQKLKEASEQISQYASDFEDIYKRLLESAQTMGEAWVGTDNLEFVEKITNITTHLSQMVEKLKVSSQTLDQQAKNYSDTRDNNIAQVAKLD